MKQQVRDGLTRFWSLVGGAPEDLTSLCFVNQGAYFSSAYQVSELASALVGGATLSVAAIKRLREGSRDLPACSLSELAASAVFRSEALLQPLGWKLPEVWDPIAGDYCAKDGWIRLHTNYAHHKQAALAALGLNEAKKELVAAAVKGWPARALELEVVKNGGCAAAMFSEAGWAADGLGGTTLEEPLVELRLSHKASASPPKASGGAPLANVKVLDLTRVLAGPECTRFLSAWGAQVLRIDPPAFAEVPAIVPDVTVGKKCACLDFRKEKDSTRFLALVREAHVLVLGYRAEALAKFGLSVERLYEVNPGLIIARLNAYGWKGNLRERRGFDSLVQMSSGIAARGAELFVQEKPVPLPAQALDHGAGFVLAAGVCRALEDLWSKGENRAVATSLIGVANFLMLHFRNEEIEAAPAKVDFSPALVEVETEWGKAKRVANPGVIEGMRGDWRIPAGSLGRHSAGFL